ncbi:hypothetical protein [Blastomonas fulva]|uniref:hypothetical protein n=1 Tax=Blastomonas fulva TaxID=1550728 RepID=UPI003F70FCDD
MTFSTQKHGRYDIRSGPLKGAWAANAFRGKALITQATGSSRDEVVSDIKAHLDRMDAVELSTRDQEGAPSATVYEQAFLAIGELNEGYRAMLRAHLQSPDHLISATRLADAAGYVNWSAANLHYGLLGARIAEEINFHPPSRPDGSKIWTCAIARDPGVDPEFPDTSLTEALGRKLADQHFEWQMRPQVVEALRALGY